jgi:hypothetical protein
VRIDGETAMVSGDPPKAERSLATFASTQRPPVTRLSRKVLIGLAGVALLPSRPSCGRS